MRTLTKISYYKKQLNKNLPTISFFNCPFGFKDQKLLMLYVHKPTNKLEHVQENYSERSLYLFECQLW